MCHDESGGTHQILIRKLDDAMTRRKPCTIEHSRIPYRSPRMGQKKTSTKNILNHLEQKNLSGLPLAFHQNIGPKHSKGKAIEKSRKDQNISIWNVFMQPSNGSSPLYSNWSHLLQSLQARRIVTGCCAFGFHFCLTRYMFFTTGQESI